MHSGRLNYRPELTKQLNDSQDNPPHASEAEEPYLRKKDKSALATDSSGISRVHSMNKEMYTSHSAGRENRPVRSVWHIVLYNVHHLVKR